MYSFLGFCRNLKASHEPRNKGITSFSGLPWVLASLQSSRPMWSPVAPFPSGGHGQARQQPLLLMFSLTDSHVPSYQGMPLREADTALSFTQPAFTGPLFRLEETLLFSQWTDRCKLFCSTPLPYSTSCWQDSFWSLILLWVHAWQITQSCLTLCSPMGSGSSVHGILQARILEWVAMPSYRGSSQPRDQTCVFCISWIAGGFFTV